MTTTPVPTVDDQDESPTRRRVRRILTTLVILACLGGLVIAAQHTERGDKDEPSVSGAPKTVVELQAPSPAIAATTVIPSNARRPSTLPADSRSAPRANTSCIATTTMSPRRSPIVNSLRPAT